MSEIIGIFRNQALKILFKIDSCGSVGILENDETGAGVLDKNGHDTGANSRSPDDFLNLIGDFVSSFAPCGDFEGFRVSNHALEDTAFLQLLVKPHFLLLWPCGAVFA